jgi:hypothetical protein
MPDGRVIRTIEEAGVFMANFASPRPCTTRNRPRPTIRKITRAAIRKRES